MGTTVKRNVYSPGQNLNNLSVNVDDNRIENDQSIITVNFGTTPATVTILTGSKFEVNGNSYVVTADEVFQMSNAAHTHITYDGTNYGSAVDEGTFVPSKLGYYQTGNTDRTLRWYIDQADETYALDLDMIAVGTGIKFTNTVTGRLHSTLGRSPTGYIHNSAISEVDYFNELDPAIPNTGDNILLTGGTDRGLGATSLHSCSRAERTSATSIVIYLMASTGSSNTLTLSSTGTNTFEVSLAW